MTVWCVVGIPVLVFLVVALACWVFGDGDDGRLW